MKKLFVRGWKPAAVLLLLFILWEAAVRLAEVPAWLLPPPSDILAESVESWTRFSGHLASTVLLSLSGFALGTVFGLTAAIILHRLPAVRESVYPLLILSQNVPVIILAPLLVIWFGFGLLPKFIVIILVCFFPITVAALDGFRQVPAELKHYMAMSGATKRQLFWKLEWPGSLPSLFSGLKISATYSVMGAVISEWLGSEKGIGVFMTLASSSFRTDRVFVAIFAIMILSLIFFGAILLAESLILKWNKKEQIK